MDDLDKALAGLIGTPVTVAKPPKGGKAPTPQEESQEIWFLIAETLLVERTTCSCGAEWEIPHGIYHHYKSDEPHPRFKQHRWVGSPLGAAAGPFVRRDVKVLERRVCACSACWSHYSLSKQLQHELPFVANAEGTLSPKTTASCGNKPLTIKPITPAARAANLEDLRP